MSHAFSFRARCAIAASAGTAALLAACGTPAAPTPPTPSTRSATPLSRSPLPSLSGPVPTGVTTGTPPVTYSVPAGFGLDLATDQEVQLASTAGTEQILFTVDPAAGEVSHPATPGPVGGGTGDGL